MKYKLVSENIPLFLYLTSAKSAGEKDKEIVCFLMVSVKRSAILKSLKRNTMQNIQTVTKMRILVCIG